LPRFPKVSLNLCNALDLQNGRLAKISEFEKDIKDKSNEIKKWGRGLSEIKRDRSLPEGKRRERRRNDDTGVMETPWPRDYVNETRVLTNKINAGDHLITKRSVEIRNIQSQHDFFETLVRKLEGLEDVKEQECPICLSPMGEGELVSVLPCGHFTCSECCQGMIAVSTPRNPASCPECRAKINEDGEMAGRVMTVIVRQVKPGGEEEELSEEYMAIEKFGSKVIAFIKFAQETMEADPNAKIILFIQFTRFAPKYSY
jgi:hypothetical protein